MLLRFKEYAKSIEEYARGHIKICSQGYFNILFASIISLFRFKEYAFCLLKYAR
jgi:hypothetical protein